MSGLRYTINLNNGAKKCGHETVESLTQTTDFRGEIDKYQHGNVFTLSSFNFRLFYDNFFFFFGHLWWRSAFVLLWIGIAK